MRKVKISIAVFLTLTLLAAGAYFPNIVSHILDWQHNGAASYNPIASVRLEIKKDVPSLGRLAMMCRMDRYIELTEGMASMTKEEVMTAVCDGLTPYVDAQLMEYLMEYSENDIELYPCLIQVPDLPDLQGVVWLVTVTSPNAASYLDMAIDDETGHILGINYTCDAEMNAMTGVEALNVFADIFFSSLGIEDYWYFAETNWEYGYVGENAYNVRYSFGDRVYGEININLCVYKHGFFVEFEFPNM